MAIVITDKDSELICTCKGIKRSDFKQAVLDGAMNFFEFQEDYPAGTGCKECLNYAAEVFNDYRDEHLGY
jgi:bacterioferritin-associated ferredoxin